MTRRRKLLLLVGLLVVVGAGVFLAFGRGSRYPRRDPTGERFPSVAGESLDGATVRVPEDLAGAPAILFVGYAQETQFDIDRWALGLDQAGVRARVVELPTIPGLAARLASGWIDGGMRKGIPREDWGAVVTLYGDADPVARFLGNEPALPARVVLLDAQGKVAWFHDEGYSVGALGRLREALARVAPQ